LGGGPLLCLGREVDFQALLILTQFREVVNPSESGAARPEGEWAFGPGMEVYSNSVGAL